MAIEFQCPYCSAAVRVADNAAGKQGRCPACQQRVLVPTVAQPPAAAFGSMSPGGSPASPAALVSSPITSAPVPSAPADASPTTWPSVLDPSSGGAAAAVPPFDFSAGAVPTPTRDEGLPSIVGVDQAAPGPDPFSPEFASSVPSGAAAKLAYARRKRQLWKRTLMRLVVPLMSIATLLGVIAIVTRKPPVRLEGTLEATVLAPSSSIPSRVVPVDSLGVPGDVAQPVLDSLSLRPEMLVSDRMRIKFRGEPKRGLEISVEPGVQMRFVRIDPKKNATLADVLIAERTAWDALRLDELKPAVKEMMLAFDTARKEQANIRDLPGYRDSVGLAGLTKGTGYVVQAVSGNAAYRCVGEDSDGKLYFLLPTGAKSFTLTGRKLPNGGTPFVGHFDVTLNVPDEAEPEKAAPEESAMPKEDDEDGLAPRKKPGAKSKEPVESNDGT